MIERVIEGEVIDRRRTNPGFDSAFDWTAWQRAASGSTTPLDTAAALAAYLSAASVIRGPASTGIDLYA
jgi:hypothetical protein